MAWLLLYWGGRLLANLVDVNVKEKFGIYSVLFIGSLVAFALPLYHTAVEKAKFTEVVVAATAVKSLVKLCTFTKPAYLCNQQNDHAIREKVNNIKAGNTKIAAFSVEGNGIITAKGSHDVGGSTYILMPLFKNNRVTWQKSGSCVEHDVC